MHPSLLITLLVSSASNVIAFDSQLARDGCIGGNFRDLVIRDSCGDDLSIAKCLAKDVDLRSLDQIEQCFVAGGCDVVDSAVSAVWFTYECNESQEPVEEDYRQDLKKRADSSSSSSSTETVSSTSTSATTSSSSSETTTTTSDSTTSTSSSSGTVSSTSASSSSSSSSTSGSTSGSTVTSTSATSSGTGLTCSTTTYITTSTCSYGTGTASGVSLGCASTSVASLTCADGLLCYTSTSSPVCMTIDNTLTTSGLAVTLLFGIGIAGLIAGFIVMGCQDRKKAREQIIQRNMMLDRESEEEMKNRNLGSNRLAKEPEAFGQGAPLIPQGDR